MRRRAIVVGFSALAALAAAGCSPAGAPSVERADTAEPLATTTVAADPPAESTSPASPAGSVPEPSLPGPPPGEPIVDGVANGLILVLDRDAGAASLEVVGVDGTPVATLSTSADETIIQPAWSPDGRRVVWARTTDGIGWELVHAAVDGSDERTVPLPGRPDYLTFDPTSSRVLALTPSTAGFGLVVVEVVGEPVLRLADLGRPYFTDFAPDGTRVVAHVGDDVRLVEVAADDREPEPLGDRSTTHQAPQWHPSDDLIVYTADGAYGGDGSAELIVRDLAAGTATSIGVVEGFALFDLDPAGQRVAVSSLGGGTAGDSPRALRRAALPPDLPALSVVDIAGGDSTPLADAPTAAPLWNPTGTQVLARDSIGDRGRWLVFDPARPTDPPVSTDVFTIAGSEMPLYLRFWDQYVRSQTVWAPDGSAFVHVGTAADGRSGVWVHDAKASGPSAFLREGDLAFWSPT